MTTARREDTPDDGRFGSVGPETAAPGDPLEEWEGAPLPPEPTASFSRHFSASAWKKAEGLEEESGAESSGSASEVDSSKDGGGPPRWSLAGDQVDAEEDPTERGLPNAPLPRATAIPAASPSLAASPLVGDSMPNTLPLHSALEEQASASGLSRVRQALDDVGEPEGPVYRLVRLVGQGGMGEVWEAVQTSLGRSVAVKRIRRARLRGFFARGDRQRAEAEFRQEALATAYLEHPNIVPVHDLGSDPSGAPLISMKLVKGEPWERLLREDFAALPAPDYLAKHLPILIDVAQAVAFAHDKGIVHRDLKPGQVMVGEFGETLLMDWGLAIYAGRDAIEPAKGTSQPPIVGKLPLARSASSPSGTPALMAPEQARSKADGVGKWTDVYLLGATLYYVLTGTYPHEAATARGAIQKSLAGIVDPPESRAPNRLVPPELRALVLQAMAFEPSERTGSALEFIARLQDYLSGASRRRQAIELAEKAGETLSEAGSSYEELEECLSLLARSRALWPDDSRAAALRDEALSAYAEAGLGAGDLALARVQASRVAEEGARADLLRRVEAAEAAARAQARQRRWALAASATLLAVVILGGGLSWRRIAEERDAALENARQARRARGDSEALARFMISDLRPRLKELERLDLLDETARRALGHYLRQDAGDLAPDERVAVARGLNSLGQLLLEQGDTAQALVAYRATLDLCGGLPARTLDAAPWRAIEADALNGATDTMQRRGDLAAALNSSDRAVARARELARLDPEDARRGQRLYLDSLLRRAQLVATRGLVVEATELGREAVELAGRHAERSADQRLWRHLLSRALAEYSDALALAGRLDEALALSLNALEDARTRAGDLPDDSNARRDLVAALVRASDFANRSGRAGQAKELAADALARISALSRTDPLNMSLQRDLAVGLNKVGLAAMDTGAIEEARSCFAEAVAMLRRLSDLDPRNRTWRRDLSVSMDLLADSLRRLRRQEEALALYDETLEFARVALSLDPENVQLMRDVAIGNEHRGMALGELGRQEDSLAAMMEGLAAWRDLLRASPGSAPSQEGLAFGLEKVGTALSKLGRKEEGIERLREAAAHLEELRDAFPHDEHYGASVGLVRCASGLALMELERFDEGRAELTAAIDALRPACAREPENMLWSSNLAHALEGLGTSCSSKGLHEEALRHLAAAAEERRRIADYAPNDYARARALAVSYGILGSGHSTAGDPASALASLLQGREAIARLERIVPDSPDAAMLDQFFTSYIAAFHLQLGQTDDARAAIGELIESGWKEPALYAAAKAAGIDVPEELLPAMNEAEAEPGQSADAPGDSAAAAE